MNREIHKASFVRNNKLFNLHLIMLLLTLCTFLNGCETGKSDSTDAYVHISEKEAEDFVDKAEESHSIIVDVRGRIAWEQGHIPNSIPIWYEDLEKEDVKELPNKEQRILLYCDEGILSKKAADYLVKKGYKNVYEFDGLKVWKGKIELDEKYKDLENF